MKAGTERTQKSTENSCRQDAQDYLEEPLSKGMSEETRAFLTVDSSSEEEDSEPEDATAAITPPIKRKEKLPRAQRNRQKRIRAQQVEEEKRKRAKKLMKSYGEAKTVAKN